MSEVKQLFDEKENWTNDAKELERQATVAIRDIVQAWSTNHYPIRDIKYILDAVVYDEIVSVILDKRGI